MLTRFAVLGYAMALLAQGGAIALTLLLGHLFPAFAFPSALPLLVVVAVGLRWGTGPSLLTALVGAVLLDVVVLAAPAADPAGPTLLADTLLFLAVSLGIILIATQTARARRVADQALARSIQSYAGERAQRERAEQAIRLRDDVLALATHDLRAPLVNVRGRTQLVRRRLQRGLPVEAAWLATQLHGIDAAVERLHGTIDEISDVARLQIGQALELQRADVDLGAMVRIVVEEEHARLDGPVVDVAVPAAGPWVNGDRVRLARVLHNLIGNAIKYSPHGTPVTVDVWEQEQWAALRVRDAGVGIPAADLPSIFTRFFRASTAQGIDGTGIGLAGAKAMIEQHNGHITLESVQGQGTTVTVHLPRTTPRPVQMADEGA